MNEKLVSFKDRLLLDTLSLQQGLAEAKNDTKTMRTVNAIYGFAIAFVLGGQTAFAQQITIVDQVKKMLSNVFSALDGLITAVAAVAVGVALLMYIVSNNPQKVDGAKTWAIRAILGLIVFKLLGFVFADSSSITGGAPDISW